MKVLAARRRDADDVRFPVRHLNLHPADRVLDLCAEIFPDEPVPDRVRLVLEDVFPDGPLLLTVILDQQRIIRPTIGSRLGPDV